MSNPKPQDLKGILADFMEDIWNNGREDMLARYVAPAYTIHHDPHDPWHGQTLDHATFAERLRAARAPFPDQRFNIQELLEDGPKVAASWFWQGTHEGEVAGIPPSGKRISMSGLTIYSFEGEKLSGHWQAVDRLGVYQQLMANRG